jgi:four helix bundle protein
MKDFKELDVWIEGKKLVLMIYKTTETFPKHELFGLTNQIRRAGVSVPSNIAEGIGRKTAKEAAHFLYTSRGSLFEIETQVIISFELGYMPVQQNEELQAQIQTCRRLINGMINYFEKQI